MGKAIVHVGLVWLLVTITGCSFKHMAVNMTADIMVEGAPAFEEENDLILAEQAIGGNLKVLESFLKVSPDNDKLQVLLSKSYGGYAFAFIEDRYEALKESNPRKAAQFKRRASNFYLRGKRFGFRYLKDENSDFREALNKDFSTFEASLEDFDEDHVEGLFFSAYNWGGWVNMNLHAPEAIVDAPKMERMMNRVLELNEKFYYAGPHIFYGVYYGGRPPMLGGNKKKAKYHFERALSLSGRKFLLTQVLYAQYYAVQTQNQKLFRRLLNEVISADDNILPEQNMVIQLAKRKARRLLANRGDLF